MVNKLKEIIINKWYYLEKIKHLLYLCFFFYVLRGQVIESNVWLLVMCSVFRRPDNDVNNRHLITQ